MGRERTTHVDPKLWCGICKKRVTARDAGSFRRPENGQMYRDLQCGHVYLIYYLLREGRSTCVEYSFDSLTGAFSLEYVSPLPRMQGTSAGRLKAFLAAVPVTDRNIKAAMSEAFESKGHEGLMDFIDLIAPHLEGNGGVIRLRLLMLALALTPFRFCGTMPAPGEEVMRQLPYGRALQRMYDYHPGVVR